MTIEFKTPVNLMGKHFGENKFAYYAWLRENAPVHKAKIGVLPMHVVSRYEDCVTVLKDPRFVRNRTTVTGGKNRLPFPMPKSLSLLAESMIIEDDPEHRRLRGLVHKAFTPRSLQKLEARIETLTHELIDKMEQQNRADGHIELMEAYALPVPVTVIAEMMGVDAAEVPELTQYIDALTNGLSGLSIARTVAFDVPKAVKFCRGLIERKRKDPQDDILTALIEAEIEGETLSEDELISMVFLLIVAGHETTVHLITNSVLALLRHPNELERLKAEPELMETAVEEILRYYGPIHGTKPQYPTEDVTMHGVTIPKGKSVMPLLGAANRDPAVFDDPETFDITRTPNRHLGFGLGIHYCLGAPLARIETQIALKNLLERVPNLRLAVPESELSVQKLPGWHRYDNLPIALG